MTLKELYRYGTDTLEDAGCGSPEIDAFYLLEYVTGTDRTSYLMDKDRTVTPDAESRYMDVIKRRASHVPYQYITGEADFAGLKIHVTEDVLIPRLDTEVLFEEAEKVIPEGGKVLDMCTGSGCLACAIRRYRPDVQICASDISEKALEVAAGNARALSEAEGFCDDGGIRFIRSDLFENFKDEDIFDVIISNPPYVTEAEYSDLMPEVKDHEPRLALTAGYDGLDIYRRLIPDAVRHLAAGGVCCTELTPPDRTDIKKGGWLCLEIGCSQADVVTALMKQAGYKDISVVKDLAGFDRVVLGRIL